MPVGPRRRLALLVLAGLAIAGHGPDQAQAQAPPMPAAPVPAALATPQTPDKPEAPATPAAPGPVVLPGMPEEAFEAALRSEDLAALERACQDSARFDRSDRLRLLRERLVAMRPAPQPFAVILVNANALISCLAPESALTVLDRYGPGPGREREQWLVQQWRAANAALDHRRAAEALRRLAAGRIAQLETMPLPLRLREDGSLDTRSALDVLAGHLEVLGRSREAAEVLLAGRLPGTVAAERLERAVILLVAVPLAERNALLELALNQAAADGAWGLAAQLLDLQQYVQRAAGADPRAAADRRLRLSRRIDDAYGEWLLERANPEAKQRAAALERELRSPRAAGGHASPGVAGGQASPAPATGPVPPAPNSLLP